MPNREKRHQHRKREISITAHALLTTQCQTYSRRLLRVVQPASWVDSRFACRQFMTLGYVSERWRMGQTLAMADTMACLLPASTHHNTGQSKWIHRDM